MAYTSLAAHLLISCTLEFLYAFIYPRLRLTEHVLSYIHIGTERS